jgi:WD40 repeat protein
MRNLLLSLILLLTGFGVVSGQDDSYIPPIDTATIEWSPDGQYIAVASPTVVNILEAARLEFVNSFNVSNEISSATVLAWSPDGQRIVFTNKLSVEIWYQPSGDAVLEQSLDENVGVDDFAWNPTKPILAIGDGEYVYFWDISDYTLIENYHSGDAMSLEWYNDGEKLIIGGSLFVEILNLETTLPEQEFRLEPFLSPEQYYINPYALDVELSPSEEELAVGSYYALYLINPSETGFYIPTYGSYSGNVYSVAWHPSGKYLATSGEDGTIRVWDMEAKAEIHRIEYGEYVYLHSVTWSPDGSQLVYGAPSGEAELVFVDSSEFLPSE